MSSPSTPRLSCPGPRIRSRRLHSRPALTISRPCCAAGRGFADPVCPPAAPVFGSDGCFVEPRLEVVRAHSPPSFGAFGLRPPGRRSEEAPGLSSPGLGSLRGGGARGSRFGAGALLPPTGPAPHLTRTDDLAQNQALLEEPHFQPSIQDPHIWLMKRKASCVLRNGTPRPGTWSFV